MLANVVVYGFIIYVIIVLVGLNYMENRKFMNFVFGYGYLLLTGIVLMCDKLYL